MPLITAFVQTHQDVTHYKSVLKRIYSDIYNSDWIRNYQVYDGALIRRQVEIMPTSCQKTLSPL
jgi:hypothetical protein